MRDAFLSHRSVDKPFVRRLAADIESAQHRGGTLSVWLDEAEIRGGQSITRMVNTGLEASRFIVLVLTPAYFTSESGWTDAEWHAALGSDPDNRQGRILPILVADCPYIPILLRHLLFEDFRDSRYGAALGRLLRVLRDEPLPRPVAHRGQLIRPSTFIDRATLVAERSAVAADPDAVEENLSCNLLPIERLPSRLYEAPLVRRLHRRGRGADALASKDHVKETIRQAQREAGVSANEVIVPAFRLCGDRVITFSDLQSPDGLLASAIDRQRVEVFDTGRYVLDLENRKLVVALINMGLERHLFAKGLRVDRSRRGPARFFFPPEDGRSRVIGWRPFKKEASRTVAKPYLRGDETRFWLHQAAYIKPVFLAARFYLQITPTWLLTRDGTTVMGGPEVGKVVIQWAGRERNSSILYHVRFWTWILGNRSGPLHVRLGDQFMEVSPIPAYVHQSYGIEWDRGNLMDDLERDAPRIARTEDAIEVEDAPDEEPTGGEVVVDAREDAEERDAAE